MEDDGWMGGWANAVKREISDALVEAGVEGVL